MFWDCGLDLKLLSSMQTHCMCCIHLNHITELASNQFNSRVLKFIGKGGLYHAQKNLMLYSNVLNYHLCSLRQSPGIDHLSEDIQELNSRVKRANVRGQRLLRR
jgi:hypothetical protein